MKKILVIGASGMLGRPVTRQLYKAGFELTLMARSPQGMRDHFPSARIVEGDVLDPISLVTAMDGQDGIYINLQAPRGAAQNYPLPEREGISNIIDAATYAGIKRIAYLSSLVQNYNNQDGYHWWVFDMKQSAVKRIRSCGIPYTIFFASSFMETLDQLMMRGNKIMLAGDSKVANYFIAAEDYGKQVARSFQLPGDDNREYIIQGPEAHNWDDAAKIFISNYKKSALKTMKAPIGMMKFFGMFSSQTAYVHKICTALNNYPEKFEAEKTWNELGKPSITLAEYAQKLSD